MTSIITSKIDVTLIYPIPIWTVAQSTVPTISEEIIAAGRFLWHTSIYTPGTEIQQ